MKVLLRLWILLDVSQHALAGVVEVHEGAESVLLPCLYSYQIPEEILIMWNRTDISPRCVHRRREEEDDLRGQNKDYRDRTSMNPDALNDRNFSLILRKPRPSDMGTYICSFFDGTQTWNLTTIDLKVKVDQVELKVTEADVSVVLPCQTSAGLPDDTLVEWSRSEPKFRMVHVFSHKRRVSYCGRTEMSKDLLRTGDLSLTLRFPTPGDSGSYICTVYTDRDIRRQKVVLKNVKVSQVSVVVGAFVLLPCSFPTFELDRPSVVWRRYDFTFPTVHQHHLEQEDLTDQNQDYRGRTSMKAEALESGDLTLNLTQLRLSDTGTYTCSIRTFRGEELRVLDVELEVKERFPSWATALLVLLVLVLVVAAGLLYRFRARLMPAPEMGKEVEQVTVDSWVESVRLPCRLPPNLPKDVKVEWRSRKKTVHVYENRCDQAEQQDPSFRNRTSLNKDLMKTGNVSLTLKYPIEADSDIYTCSVSSRKENILLLRQVDLKVKVHQVEADPEVDSVQLLFRTTVQLPGDTRVEWRDDDDNVVHVYQNGSDQPGEQSRFYRTRTRMDGDLLRTGDLSLTLAWPTDADSRTYTCRVSNSDRDILMETRVQLEVKVHEVKVDPEVESILLSCRTSAQLLEDARVEWEDGRKRKLHVYEYGSDQPGEQNQRYRTRTRMDEHLLKTGDLSLILTRPVDDDKNIYTCFIINRQGYVLMRKEVHLRFRAHQVEADPEVESVLLPCRTSLQLPGDARVEWRDDGIKVHVYQNGSDQPGEQDPIYTNRTTMEDDPLKTGDLSLTLTHPVDRFTYTCRVSSREGELLVVRRVRIHYRDRQVEVEEGAESVLLPFRSSAELPGDAKVLWRRNNPKPEMIVHVFYEGAERPDQQNQLYRDRTEMEEDPLTTGHLSLTLRRPTVRDSGEYECGVWKNGKILRGRTFQLTVKAGTVPVPVQVRPGDIRTRIISVDPSPLLADH